MTVEFNLTGPGDFVMMGVRPGTMMVTPSELYEVVIVSALIGALLAILFLMVCYAFMRSRNLRLVVA